MASRDFAGCFAEIVRQHRKQKNLSQERLAEKADVSAKMVSLIERGERTPSLTVAQSISKGLSVPFWRLIKDTEDFMQEKAK
jgi:transcriptional regulator with XRE-family HTH domain